MVRLKRLVATTWIQISPVAGSILSLLTMQQSLGTKYSTKCYKYSSYLSTGSQVVAGDDKKKASFGFKIERSKSALPKALVWASKASNGMASGHKASPRFGLQTSLNL